MPSTPPSVFDSLPKAHICERVRLDEAFKNDEDPRKVCLFSNEYRDESDNPLILPVVQKCMKAISGRDLSSARDLLSFCDMDEYERLTCELLFGKDSKLIEENRCFIVPSISNSGAILLGAEFLRKQNYTSFVIEAPLSTSDYSGTFKLAGFSKQYNYRLPEISAREGRFKNMIADLEKAPSNSVLMLKMCNLDTTGIDPSVEEWETILSIIKAKEMFPFIDANFHGLISGDTELDAWPLRFLIEKRIDLFVSQSFSLNMGLFLERPANLILVQKTPFVDGSLKTHLKLIARYSVCNRPAFGALLVRNILGTPKLKKLFHENLNAIVHRNQRRREEIMSSLKIIRAVGEDQKGVYVDLELSARCVNTLASEHHIYIPSNGWICLAGLHDKNIDYVCRCLQTVVLGRDDTKQWSSPSKMFCEGKDNNHTLRKKKKKKVGK